ncbi:MAG: hypothetical protein J7L95_03570 [Prolixibacteraceae bacterium]|nr:hypothetical protein [Prolixibacteraceae bacterium]
MGKILDKIKQGKILMMGVTPTDMVNTLIDAGTNIVGCCCCGTTPGIFAK